MSFFFFLAIFLLANRLRKVLKGTQLYDKWSNLLNYSSWIILGLFVAAQIFLDNNLIQEAAGLILLAGILYYLDNDKDFAPFKFFIQAHYPLVAVGAVSCIIKVTAPDFYDKYDSYFQMAILVAWGYIYLRWITSKRQQEQLRAATQRNTELDRLVAERTAALTAQTNELQKTIELLKATQTQLIQQEKLASLGELTAGIAHEIQNPLNFVNNFSEVSIELVDEMEEELGKGDTQEAVAIAADLKQNLEKIIHHGKRADGIVKGMLQHSRASSDTKEPTNINTLADEYFRLAYHGLRAKDKSFNAELISNYAEDLPVINVVPQDIGRVLLNLLTNAFYAVHQKKKTAGTDYKPTVEVTTRLQAGSGISGTGAGFVVITVKDNGSGIPDNIRDKIMQPFFTTKPTGEGTGLGLSLSYDIVTKAHSGKIDINSKEGEYTEFTITLPI